MWNLFFCLSLIVFLLSLFLWILGSVGRSKWRKNTSPFYFFYGGVLISAIMLLYPIYSETIDTVGNHSFHALVSAVHQAMQMFSLDADSSIAMESYVFQNDQMGNLYAIFLSIELILAPILTFGVVLSFFKNLSSHFRLFLRFFTEWYVFSELNPMSIALAEDIKKHHRWVSIIFTDVFEKNEEISYELIQRAKGIHAICFKRDILGINFRNHWTGKKLYFFTMGEDEAENTNQAIEILKSYHDIPKSELYLFSTRIESELILNAVIEEKSAMIVRRINPAQSLIYQNLYMQAMSDKSDNIFIKANELNADGSGSNTSCNSIPISAVILGMGQYGTEMLKALTWFCQMDGYRLTINAFDQDILAEQRFAALCPELMDEHNNHDAGDEDAFYNIRIHSGVDVTTNQFLKQIYQIKDVSYVLVALGSDEKNIYTAIMLRTAFERMKERHGDKQPTIEAIVHNSVGKESLDGITTYDGTRYGIRFIGDLKSSYTESNIINSEMTTNAKKCHLSWANVGSTDEQKKAAEQFWRYEYYYRSSCSYVIHAKLKEVLRITSQHKSRIEHNRWNAYMRSEGFVAGERNSLAKTHDKLITFSELNDLDKAKDTLADNDKENTST